MPMSRKEARGGGSVAFPVFGILILLASYLVLADWNNMPGYISSALAAVRWPV